MDEQSIERLFFKLIKEYNEKGRDYLTDHYVKVDDDTLLIIMWRDRWSYRVVKLE